MPCKQSDFLAGSDVPPNVQTLASADLFRIGHLDDFTLHIKSVVLIRRASVLRSRSQFAPLKSEQFKTIDRNIDELVASFPIHSLFDHHSSDILNAYSNLSLATIYLHEPFLTQRTLCSLDMRPLLPRPLPSSSNGRVLMSTEMVLSSVHRLLNSSFDFAFLHPQMFLTWSVAARMMGKDVEALKQRKVLNTQAMNRNVKKRNCAGGSMEEDCNESYVTALLRVQSNILLIVTALRRGGEKCIKARRCAELVEAMMGGLLPEAYLRYVEHRRSNCTERELCFVMLLDKAKIAKLIWSFFMSIRISYASYRLGDIPQPLPVSGWCDSLPQRGQ